MPLRQRKLLATAVHGLMGLGGAAVFALSQSTPTPPAASQPAAEAAPSLAAVSRAIDPPSLPGALAPHWTSTAQGPLLTWLEPWTSPTGQPSAGQAKGHRLRASRWTGGRWSEPVTIAEGTKFFANWADTPGAIEGPDGRLYAHWLEKIGPESHDYGIRLARSEDGGTSWKPLGTLHRDGAMGEHGFVSWVRDGAWVRAFWVDGRDMSMKNEQLIGAMTLRSALVGDIAEGDIRLDGRICDCCQTAAALAAEGPLVVYRDRSAREIRDIKLVRRVYPEGPDGRLGPTATLATTTPGRSSGFPRLLRVKDRLLLVWVGEGSPQHLRAATLPAAAVK